MMQQGSWRMVGGLDLTTPDISRSRYPGFLSLCQNYEARTEGYRRVDGFERFDGRPAPSELASPALTDNAETQAVKRTAVAARRAAIGEVPGQGPVLGVWRFRGRTYAFRRGTGNDAAKIGMYASSSAGWTPVDLGERIAFDGGAGIPPLVDDTLTGGTSGATCTLKRLVRLKGSFSDGDAAGFLIVTVDSGAFENNEALNWDDQAEGVDAISASGTALVYAGALGGLDSTNDVGNVALSSSGTAQGFGILNSTHDNTGIATVLEGALTAGQTVTIRLEKDADNYAEIVSSNIRDNYGGSTTQIVVLGAPAVTGAFDDGDSVTITIAAPAIAVAEPDILTVNGAAVEQSIAYAPGANFRFANHNFYAQASGERMYGVSGADYGFEFDGTLFTPMMSGVETDRPIFLAAHQDHMFLGYPGGSVIASSIGEPTVYEAVTGAAEFGTGAEITGMVSGYRNTLFVMGANQTVSLTGTSAADWRMDVIDAESGALENTFQLFDEPTGYDDRGIRGVMATDVYGDFAVAAFSERIRPLLDYKRSSGAKPTASMVVRQKSQYRLWFDDGDCIVMSLVTSERGQVFRNFSVSRFDLDFNPAPGSRLYYVTRACSVEDADGRERLFAAMQADGYVYEMDRGVSFDGAEITAILQLPSNDLGRPANIKRFRKILVECKAEESAEIYVSSHYHDGTDYTPKPGTPSELGLDAGFWDVSRWGRFAWGAGGTANLAEARLGGRGRNIAPIILSKSAESKPHTVTGVTVLFTLGKLLR